MRTIAWLGRLVGYSAIGVAAATPAVGQWPNGVLVDQTPHNLTRPASNTNPDMAGLIRDYGEVCVYCHSPHGGPDWIGQPSAVLMNRPRPNSAAHSASTPFLTT